MRALRFALGLGLAAVACTDQSTQPRRGAPTEARLSLAVQVAALARTLQVTISYSTTGASSANTVLLDQKLEIGTSARSERLTVDLAPCLADPQHETAPENACILHVTLTVRDAGETVLDRAFAPPMVARAGEEVHAAITVGDHASLASLALGLEHTCRTIRSTGGGTMCWGKSSSGQLGVGSVSSSAIPVAVTGTPDFVQLAAGQSHTCGLTSDNFVLCWGANDQGQLGVAPFSGGRAAPTLVAGISGITAIAAGNDFTCALATTGKVSCWGNNDWGALGDGTRVSHFAPAPVQGDKLYNRLYAGGNYACAQTKDGAVFCWGAFGPNKPSNADAAKFPYRLAGTTATIGGRDIAVISGVATGSLHACGLTTDGIAYCVGKNASGQLGNASTTDSDSSIVSVNSAFHFVMIAAGISHTCGITAVGDAYCWGANGAGQLGDGSTINKPAPVRVQMPAGVAFATIAAGGNTTCAATSTATYCWGANASGQVGDGTVQNRTTPTLVR